MAADSPAGQKSHSTFQVGIFVWSCFLRNCFCRGNTWDGRKSSVTDWCVAAGKRSWATDQYTYHFLGISLFLPVPTCIDQLAWVRLWSCNQTYPLKWLPFWHHPIATHDLQFIASISHAAPLLLIPTQVNWRRAAPKGKQCWRCRPGVWQRWAKRYYPPLSWPPSPRVLEPMGLFWSHYGRLIGGRERECSLVEACWWQDNYFLDQWLRLIQFLCVWLCRSSYETCSRSRELVPVCDWSRWTRLTLKQLFHTLPFSHFSASVAFWHKTVFCDTANSSISPISSAYEQVQLKYIKCNVNFIDLKVLLIIKS